MDNTIDWLVVGCFGRVHGIKGFIRVHSYTTPRDNIIQYTEWCGFMNNQWQPLKLLKVELTAKHILVHVEDFAECKQVADLTNVKIGIRKELLPKLAADEFYWYQLINMSVINQQGVTLGVVVEIIPTGSNDVLVVEGTKRYLIPYLLKRVITNINILEQVILVDWDADF